MVPYKGMRKKAEQLKITCFSLNVLVPPLLCTHCYSVTLTIFSEEYEHHSNEHWDKYFVLLITSLHIIIFRIFNCLDSFFFPIRSELQTVFRIFKDCKLNIQQRFSVLLFHGYWNSLTFIFKNCICILFAFHESTITIKWDIEHVKSNTSNSVINVRNHTRWLRVKYMMMFNTSRIKPVVLTTNTKIRL